MMSALFTTNPFDVLTNPADEVDVNSLVKGERIQQDKKCVEKKLQNDKKRVEKKIQNVKKRVQNKIQNDKTCA